MREEKREIFGKSCTVVEYDSMSDFYKYICDTPFNDAFRWEKHSSVDGGEYFTKTKSFEEATELLKNGWTDMANKLTQKLKAIEKDVEPTVRRKTVYDVAGYQCSVPRYLNGIPTSMIRTVNVPVKQKVINLVKSVDYNGGVSADTIVEESVKAMQIIKKLEAQGYRVNLDIVIGTIERKSIVCKVRVKNAGERLNISKLAFPLVHPSMLRRLFFRFIEVYPEITKDFVRGYGAPATDSQLRAALKENEILLPAIIRKDVSKINSLEDLENM